MAVGPHHVDRIGGSPSPQEFLAHSRQLRWPVLLTEVTRDWPAREQWSFDFFRAHCGKAEVAVEVYKDSRLDADALFVAGQKKQTLRFEEVIDFAEGRGEGQVKYYLANHLLFQTFPWLRAHIGSLAPYMVMPKWLPSRATQALQVEPRLWLGPAGTVAPLHFDSAHNFFVQLRGRKQVTLIPRKDSRWVHYPWPGFSDNLDKLLHYGPIDPERLDLTRFPMARQARMFKFIVEPGELLFIPIGWWHHVRALEPSISLSFWWFPIEKIGLHASHLRHPVILRALKEQGLQYARSWVSSRLRPPANARRD